MKTFVDIPCPYCRCINEIGARPSYEDDDDDGNGLYTLRQNVDYGTKKILIHKCTRCHMEFAFSFKATLAVEYKTSKLVLE